MARPVKLTVCGSGPGPQLIAGLAASRPNFEVTVLTLESKSAEKWNTALKAKDATMITNFPRRDGSMYAEKGRPKSIVDAVGDFIAESDVIVLGTPPSLFSQYLKAVKEKIKKGTIFIGLPGCCGFEYHCRSMLGEVGEQCTFVNLECFPWQFTVVTFGVQVDIKSTLKSILASTLMGTSPPRRGPLSCLQLLLGGEVGLRSSTSFMSVQLSPFSYLVPAVLYGRWKDWDGKALEEEPGLLADVNDKTADLLQAIAEECLKITEAIKKDKPEAKLGDCKSLTEWLAEYKDCISDSSSLLTMLKTNSMMGDAKHPMKKKERKPKIEYTPEFEDILPDFLSYGLIVIRGIAEILTVPTPKLDELILWCQDKIKKVLLKDGKLVTDKNLKDTSSPQTFNITTLNGLLLIKELPPDPVMPDFSDILGGGAENKESTEKSDSTEKPNSTETPKSTEKPNSTEKSESKEKPAKAVTEKTKKKA